ncbi:hypothetical protein SEMRO_155_G070430.1 [Seminavis robusta]|uniref:Uncharacterized protein n=1 Tax=Seminavis robusta TaxID=568900 RepID=A0A9N8DNL6_9STRA|nr:hypothetical protein SEMRO_155_G070430.1 [Seminavis robusta]|eukprot:Sro155_g070430.1 n/a (563) ;mRNA; r:37438-39285
MASAPNDEDNPVTNPPPKQVANPSSDTETSDKQLNEAKTNKTPVAATNTNLAEATVPAIVDTRPSRTCRSQYRKDTLELKISAAKPSLPFGAAKKPPPAPPVSSVADANVKDRKPKPALFSSSASDSSSSSSTDTPPNKKRSKRNKKKKKQKRSSRKTSKRSGITHKPRSSSNANRSGQSKTDSNHSDEQTLSSIDDASSNSASTNSDQNKDQSAPSNKRTKQHHSKSDSSIQTQPTSSRKKGSKASSVLPASVANATGASRPTFPTGPANIPAAASLRGGIAAVAAPVGQGPSAAVAGPIPAPVHPANAAIPQFLLQKGKPDIGSPPRAGTFTAGYARGVQFICSKTRSNDMICKIMKGDSGAYVYPVLNYLRENLGFAKRVLHVDHILHLRDPQEPHEHLEVMSRNGYGRRTTCLLFILDSTGQANANTPQNRRAWVDSLVRFWNHPNTQRLFRYAERGHFRADLTPHDETAAQPLSHWLTIRDTMDVIVDSYPQFTSIGDVLRAPLVLPFYYAQGLIPEVQAHFAPYNNPPNNTDGEAPTFNAQEEQGGDYAGFRGVDF